MTQEPLRIIHCIRSPVGGVFRHIKDLATNQIKAGHDVGLICDSTTGSDFDNRLVEALRPHLTLGLARFPMKRQLTLQDFRATRDLYRHIRDLKPDVLHGHGAKGGAYARTIGTWLRLKGNKVSRLYSPHGGSLHYDPNRLEGKVYHTIERLLGRVTDGLIFVSDYEYAAFETKVGQPRCPARVVYNGLLPDEFQAVRADENAADFVYIGMLRDLKGTDLFIDALHNIKTKTGRAPRAHIVGDGPDAARYRNMVDRLGLSERVTFHGPLPARDAFRLAHTVVVPSRAEAMPYVILETIAAQRPLIATRVGGIPEIFGKFASRLVEPGSAGKLTSAMERNMQDPAAALDLAKDMRGCLAETFSAEHMSERITSLYLELRGRTLDAPAGTSDTAPKEKLGTHTAYARSSNE
ncbi:glycosyltransferase involved in cell wall biosynthesis [Roseibium hamelinense]|uniref:Glycosyltransferase involved in cell wall biosynthesis n=1 Tax=Roseibium hamelinense TaxID=150831 RepID=A0A562TGD6_9HYPH|nr:glycosyltransferase [Roseibium hamelinense]MTI46176.1 glycosyltransferase family 1 protein [Roseibium hamelinense]TWI92632.1 glycosyltransferase involved in cell wall biosynthesis [Roseibium hamelinense]